MSSDLENNIGANVSGNVISKTSHEVGSIDRRWITTFKFMFLAMLIATTYFLYQVFELGEISSLAGVGDLVVRVRGLSSEYGPLGVALFLMGGIGAIILNVPTLIILVAASAIYGVMGSMVLGLLLLNVSMTCIFFIGKKLGRDFVYQFFGRSIDRLEQRFEERGLITVIYLRLFLYAFPPMNWFLSVMKLNYRDYFLGTLIGGLPQTIMTAWLGGTIFNALAKGGQKISDYYWELAVPALVSLGLMLLLKLMDHYHFSKKNAD
ncbi:MAG: VTT domain-containing protein [Pseudomonadales bacterium]|nr:VTT domain-containing protein [Pseudomonadales bacterium]